MKGYYHYRKGEYVPALKLLIKSLAFFENSLRFFFIVPTILNVIGDTYHRKGELEKACMLLQCPQNSVSESIDSILESNFSAASSIDLITRASSSSLVGISRSKILHCLKSLSLTYNIVLLSSKRRLIKLLTLIVSFLIL